MATAAKENLFFTSENIQNFKVVSDNKNNRIGCGNESFVWKYFGDLYFNNKRVGKTKKFCRLCLEKAQEDNQKAKVSVLKNKSKSKCTG